MILNHLIIENSNRNSSEETINSQFTQPIQICRGGDFESNKKKRLSS